MGRISEDGGSAPTYCVWNTVTSLQSKQFQRYWVLMSLGVHIMYIVCLILWYFLVIGQVMAGQVRTRSVRTKLIGIFSARVSWTVSQGSELGHLITSYANIFFVIQRGIKKKFIFNNEIIKMGDFILSVFQLNSKMAATNAALAALPSENNLESVNVIWRLIALKACMAGGCGPFQLNTVLIILNEKNRKILI